MKNCSMIHEWTSETVATEEGPMTQLTWLIGCMSCNDFNECLSTARFCHSLACLEALGNPKRTPTNLDDFAKIAEYSPSF